MPQTEMALVDRGESKAKPIRHPRLEWERKVGQQIHSAKFGFGKIVAIQSDKIVVKFGKNERVMGAQDLSTRAQAEIDWHTYWLSGERRRLEEGKRLSIVKSLCEFGEWKKFLDKYNYSRSSADDLIRRYHIDLKWEARNQLPGNRASQTGDLGQRVNDHSEDPEGRERRELVKEEIEKRRGKEPTYHKTLWSIRIKLPPDVLALCRKKYVRNGKRAKEFWCLAAYIFVDLDPPRKKHRHKSHRHPESA
jgi:hypothetical protein